MRIYTKCVLRIHNLFQELNEGSHFNIFSQVMSNPQIPDITHFPSVHH